MGKFRFLLGAATGAAAALLFAPRSGKETRHLLSEKIEDAAEAAPEPIRSAAEPIIDAAEDAYSKVAHKTQEAKPETDDIKAKIAEARDALAEQITRNHVATTTVEADVVDMTDDSIEETIGELVEEAEESTDDIAPQPEDSSAQVAEEPEDSEETSRFDWYK